MQVNVVIDLDKIDYDSVNKQIKEKIDAMELDKIYPIKDMFNIGLERKVNSFLDDYIGMRYGESEATIRTKQLVNDAIQDAIKDHITEYVDKFIDNLGEEKIGEMIAEIFPNVLSQYLYNKITCYEGGKQSDMNSFFHNQVQSIITSRLHNL